MLTGTTTGFPPNTVAMAVSAPHMHTSSNNNQGWQCAQSPIMSLQCDNYIHNQMGVEWYIKDIHDPRETTAVQLPTWTDNSRPTSVDLIPMPQAGHLSLIPYDKDDTITAPRSTTSVPLVPRPQRMCRRLPPHA